MNGFNGGVFIGSGPWLHGSEDFKSEDFKGNVDNSFDPNHGDSPSNTFSSSTTSVSKAAACGHAAQVATSPLQAPLWSGYNRRRRPCEFANFAL